MRSKIPIAVKCLALRYKVLTKSNLIESLKWAEKNFKPYLQYEGNNWEYSRREVDTPYLEKEFKFRGFVPLSSFEKKDGYNYIQSNRAINGTIYVYPKACCRIVDVSGFNVLPNPYEFHTYYGIPGFTRIDVNYKL